LLRGDSQLICCIVDYVVDYVGLNKYTVKYAVISS